MTENKRFTVDNNGKYFDRLNNRYLTIDNLLNELNELNNENKELKAEVNDLKFENEKKYRTIRQLEQMLQDVER